jgi:hypothetical protein
MSSSFFIRVSNDDYLAARIVGALQNIGWYVLADISIIAAGDLLDYNQLFILRITMIWLFLKYLVPCAVDTAKRHQEKDTP